jgi:hypothetical protein
MPDHMGLIVKQVSEDVTRYVWYPGNKRAWLGAVFSLALGGAAYLTAHIATGETLMPALVGLSVTAAIEGLNLGRRESRENRLFRRAAADRLDRRLLRRRAIVHSSHAVWRRFVECVGAALGALLLANLSGPGVVSNWLLPLIPATVVVLAHQVGSRYERLGHSRTMRAARAASEVTGTLQRYSVAQRSTMERIG